MNVKFTWLGTAAFILDFEGKRIMFDPFFYRQKNKNANPILKTKREDVNDIIGVFISHSHFDHITDAGWFAEVKDVPVYCCETSKNNIIKWARGEVLEDETHPMSEKGIKNINVCQSFDEIKIEEDLKVEFIKSKHIRFDANTILARVKSKEFWNEIKSIIPLGKRLPLGDVFGFCTNYKNKKIVSFGSLYNKYTDVLKKYEDCDIFIAPLAGNSATHLAKKGVDIIDILKPKTVIPVHWDDFYPPISRIENLVPFKKRMAKKHPDVRIIMPLIDEEIMISL